MDDAGDHRWPTGQKTYRRGYKLISGNYLAGWFNVKTNQTQARGLIRKHIDDLSEEDKEKGDVELQPVSLDKAILAMLPEPIYIQAVKDLADDAKTQERTPFGKVLGVLLRAIEGIGYSDWSFSQKLVGASALKKTIEFYATR